MTWQLLLALIFIALIVLFATGMPVAFAFMLINIVGFAVFVGGPDSLSLLIGSSFDSVASFALVPIPLFILMGELLLRSGLAALSIDVVDHWIGRLPGRLAVVTTGAGTIFAALSGSSMATTAMFASTLTPEMERRGYKPEIAVGSVLAAGGLAVLIPPSVLGVLLAVLANVSVAKLLVACVIPGLILAAIYALYYPLRVFLQPHLAPRSEIVPVSMSVRVRSLMHLVPLGLLMLVVTGFIFLGIATPSETAAMGALASGVIAAAYRRMNMAVLKDSLLATAKISAIVLLIIIGSKAYSQLLAISGVAEQLVQFVTQLQLLPIVKVAGMMIVVLIMGCFIEQVSIMLITIPLFIPVVVQLGLDPVWFSVCMLINLELAGITPPFGLQLFVMKGAQPQYAMTQIYLAALPIAYIQIFVIAVIVLYPPTVLWLPSLMLQ
jgi:tripartite ATP-independent transporter DctM subunit